jgi:hypothetical protein
VTGPGGGAALAFASLSTGFAHTCGRTTGAAVYCWGANNSGQLGNDGGNLSTPTLVNLATATTITGVSLGSTTIAIEGSTTYDATLFNPGSTATGMVLQGYIIQGTTTKGAGGTITRCGGAFDGVVPPGSCTSSSLVVVSNSNGGGGTLVPGPATYQLDLISGTTVIDSKTVSVTLQ